MKAGGRSDEEAEKRGGRSLLPQPRRGGTEEGGGGDEQDAALARWIKVEVGAALEGIRQRQKESDRRRTTKKSCFACKASLYEGVAAYGPAFGSFPLR